MRKEDKICVEAADKILPSSELPTTETGMERVVAALVQIDSTFGVTPCQMRGEQDEMEFLTGSSAKQAYVNPAAARIKALQDASDQSQYGGPTQSDSSAKQAGKTFGRAINSGINTGLDMAINSPMKGFSLALNGITSELNKLHLFPNLNLDIDGSWVYNSGEKVYDVASEGAFAAFDFFNGVASEIAPSTQGRRRVVYDSDCDFITEKVDVIEGRCAAYRFERLQQLKPAIEASGRVNDQVLLNTSMLNLTWTGDPLSFAMGLRETFTKQKEAVYGINGDCLNPTAGSLAYMSTELSDALSDVYDDIKGEFDSVWTNLLRINNYSNQVALNESSMIAQGFGEPLDMSVLTQEALNQLHMRIVKSMSSSGNWNLSSIANATNSVEEKLAKYIATATKSGTDLSATYSKLLGAALARLDSLTNKLDASPQGLARFSDDLTRGVEQVLSNAIAQTKSFSRDEIKGTLSDSHRKLIDTYHSNSADAISSNVKEFENEMKSFKLSAGSQLDQSQRKSDIATKTTSSQLNGEDQWLMDALDAMATNQSMHFDVAENTVQETADAVRKLNSNTQSSRQAMPQIFASLNENTQNAVQGLETKVGQIMKVAASSVSELISSLAQNTAGHMGSQLVDDTGALSSQLSVEGRKIRESAAFGMMNAQAKTSAQQKAIQTSDLLAQSQTSALSDSNSISINSAADQWMGTGDDLVSSLQATAGANAASGAKFRGDSSGAIAAMGSSLEKIESEAETKAVTSSAGVLRNVESAGSSLNSVAGAAGDALRANQEKLAHVFSGATAAGDQMRSASNQAASQASRIASEVGSADEQSSAILAHNYRSQVAQARDEMDGSAAQSDTYRAKAMSDLASEVADSEQNVDQDTNSGETAIKSGVAKEAENQDQIQAFGSEVSSLADASDQASSGLGNSTMDQLNSASDAGLTAAKSVSAELAAKSATLSTSTVAETDSWLGKSREALNSGTGLVKRELDRVRDVKSSSEKALLGSRALQDAETGDIGKAISDSLELLTKISQGELDVNSLGKKDLGEKLEILNSSTNANLTAFNAVFSGWNQSVINQVSAAVEGLINGLQAREREIENSANFVSSGVLLNNGAFSQQSVAELEKAGFSSFGFMDTLESQRAGLAAASAERDARFGLFDTKLDAAKKVVANNKYQASAYNSFIQGELKREASKASELSQHAALAASGTNSSLGLSSSKSGSDSKFQADLLQSQTQGLMIAGKNEARNAKNLVSEASSAVIASVSQSTDSLAEMESSLYAHGAAMKDKFNSAIKSLASSEGQLGSNVTSDRSQQRVQLMMAKRAIRDLLSGWSNYVEIESEKFRKMNDSDAQYTSAMAQRIDTTNDTSGTSLRASQSNLESMSAQVMDAAKDYVVFSGEVKEGLSAFQSGLGVLNQTSAAGMEQMREMIVNLDANDMFSDESERSSMKDTVEKFEEQLDSQAKLAEQSVPY